MPKPIDPSTNVQETRKRIGYVSRNEANPEIYKTLGFRCGLEIHQQVKTEKKLFCRCPSGLYQSHGEYDAELIRHMRPTLSELGEYDGTALMEFKTKKNITYRIKDESACTYDFDDTPPFKLNHDALDIAMEVALLLKSSIVGELHITRKQYLDGSIPTGFQRTAIVGINGEIPLKHKNVRIIQLSLEEDSCREVSDIGHERIYTTDRLGMPLIETVTHPDMVTPEEAEEAGQYLRFLTRSTGKMNTGIGAARQDVNVSINGGTRVEIKGVAHLRWIPDLTHNEAFRQKALLTIADDLNKRVADKDNWQINSHDVTEKMSTPELVHYREEGLRVMAVTLPAFEGILSFFTQPGRVYANELSDRLQVIACLPKPNMTHSEDLNQILNMDDLKMIRNLNNNPDSAWILFWGPEADIETALDVIDERCRFSFTGVPNETRKSLPNGTTLFERVLPGPDRMYPDTDSAPIPIEDDMIDSIRQQLPSDVVDRVNQFEGWQIPTDTFTYLLRRNLYPVIDDCVSRFQLNPKFVGTLLGHTLRNAEGKTGMRTKLSNQKILELVQYVFDQKIESNILKVLLILAVNNPEKNVDELILSTGYQRASREEIIRRIPDLSKKFNEIRFSENRTAEIDWIMGQLSPIALGNMDFKSLREVVEGGGE